MFLVWLGIRRGAVGYSVSLQSTLALRAEAGRDACSEAYGRIGTRRYRLLARLLVIYIEVLERSLFVVKALRYYVVLGIDNLRYNIVLTIYEFVTSRLFILLYLGNCNFRFRRYL